MKVRMLSPMKCVICTFYACFEELPVCRRCLPRFHSLLTERCDICGKTATSCECYGNVRALMFFGSRESRRLMYFIKTNADGRIIDFLAELAVKACGIKPNAYDGVTFVPRLRRSVRRYGYDQAKELAKAISKFCGIPFIIALKRVGGREQKLLSRTERLKNIQGRYRAIYVPPEKYNRLLLVDDICTTGATLEACASVLRGNTSRTVTTLVIAKTVITKKSQGVF